MDVILSSQVTIVLQRQLEAKADGIMQQQNFLKIFRKFKGGSEEIEAGENIQPAGSGCFVGTSNYCLSSGQGFCTIISGLNINHCI